MTVTIIISILSVLCVVACVIIGSKYKVFASLYPFVALLFAVIMIMCGKISFSQAIKSLWTKTSVNPIKILILFFSMTLISVFLDEEGFFKLLASKAVAMAKDSQKKIFFVFYVTVSVLTVFTSNDVVILSITPFILYFCKNAKINPLPYLIVEFIGANTFSMTLLIGNPTNIYLALSARYGFFKYLKVMWLPSLVGGATAYVVCRIVFAKFLNKKIEPRQEEIIADKPLLIIGAICLFVCTVFLAISDFINVEMWIVSLTFALVLLTVAILYKIVKKEGFSDIKNTVKRIPWTLAPFLIAMFIIVSALDINGFTKKLASFLDFGNPVFTYGIISALCCNLLNNIPMSVLFSSTLAQNGFPLGATFACIVGSNVGAYLTPIGALAGIMWLNILNDHKVKFGYLQFVKYGFLIAVPTLLATLLTLFIVI